MIQKVLESVALVRQKTIRCHKFEDINPFVAATPGSEERLVAALDLKTRLKKILEGEDPYDIFIRWKPLHEQPIGWDPDLNDGIRLNIRPFVEAGVLRSTPKIHWRTDRGKDPVPNASGTVERHNDRHFKIDEKKQARERAKGEEK